MGYEKVTHFQFEEYDFFWKWEITLLRLSWETPLSTTYGTPTFCKNANESAKRQFWQQKAETYTKDAQEKALQVERNFEEIGSARAEHESKCRFQKNPTKMATFQKISTHKRCNKNVSNI